ncbi:MAG: TonB-dependent receptor plug domain-containing protein [bacterium]|nr:TonB-dependent receptor plug domain-containing protein [bacterium]
MPKISHRYLRILCISLVMLVATAHADNQEESLFNLSLEELINVKVISVTRQSKRIKDIPASVVLITREEIELCGYASLAEILENVPGLYLIDDYSEEASLGVRGFWDDTTNKNVVIMVNGVRQLQNMEANYTFRKILVPVEAIDLIEVVRGPMYVMYGTGAFFGVINITTNEHLTTGKANHLSTSVGSRGYVRLLGRSADSENGFRYSATASLTRSSGIGRPYSHYGSEHAGGTNDQLAKDERFFEFNGTFGNLSLGIHHRESRSEVMFLMPGEDDGTQVQDITTDFSVGYRHTFDSGSELSSTFTYSHDEPWWNFDLLSSDFYGVQSVPSSVINLETLWFSSPGEYMHLTFGLHYRSILQTSNRYDLPGFGSENLENIVFLLDPEDNITSSALFSQIDLKLRPGVRLVAGLRAEKMYAYNFEHSRAWLDDDSYNVVRDRYSFPGTDLGLAPQLAVLFNPASDHVLKLMFGQGRNYPSFMENTKVSGSTEPGDLETEKITTLEANYILSPSPDFTASVSIFRNELDNLIQRSAGFDDNGVYFSNFRNQGEMITRGGEITVLTRPVADARLDLSATYQQVDDLTDNADREAAYVPDWLGYGKLSYRFDDRRTVGLQGRYVGSMLPAWDPTPTDVENPDSPPIGRLGKKTPGYLTLGANVRWLEFIAESVALNVHVANIFDVDIRYPTTYASVWAPTGTLAAGRTFVGTITYEF